MARAEGTWPLLENQDLDLCHSHLPVCLAWQTNWGQAIHSLSQSHWPSSVLLQLQDVRKESCLLKACLMERGSGRGSCFVL